MRNLIRYIVIVFCLNLLQLQLYGQFDTAQAIDLQEKIEIYTDRDIYFTGDVVNFIAMYHASDEMLSLGWSKVLYVEVISYDGSPFMQMKFPLDRGQVSANFVLPGNIVTGNYYLKAYTKWMRNFSVNSYAYAPLSIINPLSDQVVEKPTAHVSDFVLDTVFYKDIETKFVDSDTIIVKTKEVAIPLDFQGVDGNKVFASVVDPDLIQENFYIRPKVKQETFEYELNFLPETRGLSLSGRVIEEKTSKPIGFAKVNITIMGADAQNFSVYADSVGKFNFALPADFGEKELFLSADLKNNKQARIWVDNDFCTRTVYLPFIPFSIQEAVFEKMQLLSNKSQVARQYKNRKKESTDSLKKQQISFYDKPGISVNLSDYIEMPNLADYFYEVVHLAGIREENGKSYIQVMGPYGELRIFPPLVLLDGIEITEIDKLLAISPKLIERIEVFGFPYLIGDITYGGIVNVFSRNGDNAGIKFPETSLLFDYKFFTPKTQLEAIHSGKVIDISNHLYWNAALEGEKAIRFNVGDNTEDYFLLIRKVDQEGHVFQKVVKVCILGS